MLGGVCRALVKRLLVWAAMGIGSVLGGPAWAQAPTVTDPQWEAVWKPGGYDFVEVINRGTTYGTPQAACIAGTDWVLSRHRPDATYHSTRPLQYIERAPMFFYGHKCALNEVEGGIGGEQIVEDGVVIEGIIWWGLISARPICPDGTTGTFVDGSVKCGQVSAQESPECICEPGDSPVANPPQALVGNPIALDSGTKLKKEEDYATADGLFQVARNYRSRPRNPNLTRSVSEIPGFGSNWHGILPGRLMVSGSSMGFAEYQSPAGTVKRFSAGGGDQWEFTTRDATRLVLSVAEVPSEGRTAFFQGEAVPGGAGEVRLAYANGDYILFRRAETYDAANLSRYLVPVEHGLANGYKRWFDYPDTGQFPHRVRDNLGREMLLTWSEIGWVHPKLRGYSKGPNQVTPPAGMELEKAISAITLPDGSRLAYAYGETDASGFLGRLESVSHLGTADELLWGRTYLYEDARFPAAITGTLDQTGQRLSTYAYDELGRAILTERAGGVDRQQITYSADVTDGSPHLRQVTNPLGLTTGYEFSGFDQNYVSGESLGPDPRRTPRRLGKVSVAGSADIPAHDVQFHYTEDSGLLSGGRNARGYPTIQVVDAETKRPLQVTDANGVVTTIEWHATLDLPTKLVQPGLTTEFTYDLSGRLLSRTDTDTTTQSEPYSTNGETRTLSYSWADNGRLLSVNGPRPANDQGQDDITTFDYDAAGNLLTVTDALGHISHFAGYDANGRPGETTDPNGIKMLFSYDERGRLKTTTVKHPSDPGLDAITTIDYDVESRVIGLALPETAKLSFDYDLAGRLLAMRADDGERIDYGYDAMGNVLSETVKREDGTQARGVVRSFDALGRMLSETLGAGRTTSWTYDNNGNPTKVVSPRSFAAVMAFDPLDRLISVVAPDGGTSTIEHDALGGKSHTDAISVQTQFLRNGFGEIIQETSPDRGVTKYFYDAAGDLTAVVDGRRQRVNYVRDILGRVTKKVPVGLPDQAIVYVWDVEAVNGSYGVGRLGRINDASGITRLGYDHRGNLTVKQQQLGTTGFVSLRFAYDLADRVTRVTYPSGRIVGYVRDAKGRVRTVRTKASAAIQGWTIIASGLAYEPFGSLRSAQYGNGLRVVNNWGDDNRLLARRLHRAADDVDVSFLRYSYDNSDNVTAIKDSVDPTKDVTYRYDAADRLVRADAAAGDHRRTDWFYDLNGNRTAVERRAQPDDAAPAERDIYRLFPETNRLKSVNGPNGLRTIAYDRRGNTSSETRGTSVNVAVGYDGFGRLGSYARTGEATHTHAYNGLDDRVSTMSSSLSGSALRRFVYGMDGRVLGEYGADPSDLKAEFIWLLPEVADANGMFGGNDGMAGYAPLAVAVPSATAGATELNWVHGNHIGALTVTTDASGTPILAYGYRAPGFPGQSRTHEDLYYNRYRDYDSTTGRYIQADPIGLAGGANPYLYAMGNPLRYTDPDGLKSPSAGEVIDFAFDDWLNKQRQPKLWRKTPAGRIWAAGELIGAAAAVGVFLCTQDDDDDDPCAEQRRDDELKCNQWHIKPNHGGYTRWEGYRICMETAATREGECRARGNDPNRITTPLFLPGPRRPEIEGPTRRGRGR